MTAVGADTGAKSGEQENAAAEPVGIRLERIIATRIDLGRGRFLRRLSGRPAPRLFLRPFGAAWDRDDLLVTDPGRGDVLRIDSKGRLQRTPPDLFDSPIGVAACRAGILVSDSRRGRVALLDRELRLVRWVAEDLRRSTGVACDGDRIIIVETARHRILALEPSGWLVEGVPGATRMVEVRGRFFVPGGEGALFVYQQDRVVRVLGRRGSGTGEFNFPTVITPGAGALWVGDTLNFRIQGFQPLTGEFTSTFGRIGDSPGEMPRLKGLVVDAEGRLWISDAHLEQIAIYRGDGRFLTALGGPGQGPGDFSFPAGLAAHPDGRVAVVDSLNRRVQIFRVLQGPA